MDGRLDVTSVSICVLLLLCDSNLGWAQKRTQPCRKVLLGHNKTVLWNSDHHYDFVLFDILPAYSEDALTNVFRLHRAKKVQSFSSEIANIFLQRINLEFETNLCGSKTKLVQVLDSNMVYQKFSFKNFLNSLLI